MLLFLFNTPYVKLNRKNDTVVFLFEPPRAPRPQSKRSKHFVGSLLAEMLWAGSSAQ